MEMTQDEEEEEEEVTERLSAVEAVKSHEKVTEKEGEEATKRGAVKEDVKGGKSG